MVNTIKIGIITINYGRPKIFRLWCASIKRIRRDLGYIPVVVVSGEEDKIVCNEYNIEHITQRNHPATQKFNTAMKFMRDLNVKAVIIMGSDDIADSSLIKKIIDQVEQNIDLIGVKNIYFYSTTGIRKGILKQLKSTNILGVCRCLSKSVLDSVDWTPWSRDSSWGMDGICMKTILPYIKTHATVEGMVVDCKSSESLNKFSFWDGKLPEEENPSKFYEMLSVEELQILNEI